MVSAKARRSIYTRTAASSWTANCRSRPPAHYRKARADKRFEVDGANVARDLLRSHDIAERDIETVWPVIAQHTTPGIPQFMHRIIALVTAGVEMDVLGIAFSGVHGC